MASKDRRGTRTGRRSRPKRSASTKRAEPDAKPEHPHPVFGPIPLIIREWIDADGTPRASYDFDLDYQPPLPPGAVRGNPHGQRSRGAFDVPRYFYVDREHRCVQCRELFIFGAREQKHWYETLGFNFASVAIRCPTCRRQRRSDKALHHAVADAKREVLAKPDDAAAQLALAEAIVELHARDGHGKLDEALAAARKARRLLQGEPATARVLTHYWEARAHALGGRMDRARAAFETFLASAGRRAHRQEIRAAEAWLAQHPRDQ